MPRRPVAFRIASPCDEDWSAMSERAGGRHCGSCDRVVHELHSLTRGAAERLVREVRSTEGRVCARIAVDADGAPLFAPGNAPLRRVPQAFALATVLVAGCTDRGGHGDEKPAAVLVPLEATRRPVDAGSRDAGSLDAGAIAVAPCTSAASETDAREAGEPTDRQLAARARRKHARTHPPVYILQGMMDMND